jgi:putative RecB family exonuclease
MITAEASTPNQVAKRLTGRDYISYSAASTYQQCPLRYYFKYVAGLPETTVSSSLVFGGAIHKAIEFHFNSIMAGEPPPDLDALLAEYQGAWHGREGIEVTFSKDETRDTLGRLADRMLRAFQASSMSHPEGTIIGVEEEFRGALVAGCPDLLARVDLLIDTPTERVVTDLKTSRSRWSKDQAEGSVGQLLLYSELVGRLMPKKLVRLEFAVITKAKAPTVDLLRVAGQKGQIERTKVVVERVWRAIVGGHFYPSPSPINCGNCPYRAPCRMWPN